MPHVRSRWDFDHTCMRCNSCCDVLHCCQTFVGVSKFFVYLAVKWMPVQSNALLHHMLVKCVS